VFAVLSLLFVLIVVLSLPNVQSVVFPDWLIKIWGRVVAVAAILAIGTILLLPVLIEANLNPRPLSGPGRIPHRPDLDNK
jgi:hypothetical protein